MTKEEILEAARLRVRKSGQDILDKDIERLAAVALEDLERIGVNASWLESPEDPLIVEAVLNYVKANYSISDQYETLIGIYNMTLTKIKGASKYRLPAPDPKVGNEDGSDH